ncbi:response regulator receiver protein [Chthoniobacter flavus Ellin428]|uniref:Response regulator receiver protein n=1 Tax=Chthoniobacter flavus Ellin428 TaxID=497964 RepID=B4DA13_9BACT|nr:response regulator [Chthoniobacter flavus]EDY16640.1 response regulator receiver protein [Chthoniobacter flavus Ellin428]TCO87215.1 response regulator receiver domain-containing protein [Chthoniobacter flavus]
MTTRADPTLSSPSAIKHVLIVDQDDMIRTVLCTMLRSWGFSTCAAATLIGACRTVVSDGPFDAIICNYDLPDGTAFNLVEWMTTQQLEVPTLVPYGALPPTSPAPDNVRLVSKPFDPEELRTAIDRAHRRAKPVIRRKSALGRRR